MKLVIALHATPNSVSQKSTTAIIMKGDTIK